MKVVKILKHQQLKKIVVIFFSAILSIIILLYLAPIFFNANQHKPYIKNKFTQVTGRSLILNGPIKLSLFPEVHLQVESFIITNPLGFKSLNFFEAEKLDLKISWLPLLYGKLQFKYLELTKAKLNLEQTNTAKNWNLGAFINERSNTWLQLAFNEVLFNGVEISYINSKKSQIFQTQKLNIFINRNGGEIWLNNQEVALKNATINIDNIVEGLFNIKAKIEPELEYNGSIQINKFVPKKIADKVGVHLPEILNRKGYSSITLSSKLAGTDKNININNFKLNLGKSNVTGDVFVGWNPYQLINNIKIDKTEVSDYIDINGFKLGLESAVLTGKLASNNNKLISLNGQESLSVTKLVLYGINIRKMNKRLSKVLSDISNVERLITYTQTLATIKSLRREADKIEKIQKKDHTDYSNLGNFNGRIIFKNNSINIAQCNLRSPEFIGICSGNINLQAESLFLLVQGRVLPVGKKSVINYIYFPYYVKGSYQAPEAGLDTQYIIEQVVNYYNTSQNDKSTLSKLWDRISNIFKV